MQNIYSVYILVLKAPWFHFIILLGLVFRVFTTFPTSQSKVSRFRLLVKHRMALGRLRANRVSYVELLSLRNTPACLHSLEFSCGIAQARSLSAQSAGASLEDLLYMSRASDGMFDYLGQLIAKHSLNARKERRRKQRMRTFATDTMPGNIIDSFLLIILILSLFVKSEENLRNVILYRVPGLSSLSISKEETYSNIRKKIRKLVPNFTNFYFVHRGLIIKEEDVGIDESNGHVVLHVHSRGDLKGGAKEGRKKRRVRKRCLTDDDFTPELEAARRKRKWKSRGKSARSRENRNRTAEQRKRENAQRSAEQRKRENAQRSAEQRKRKNA